MPYYRTTFRLAKSVCMKKVEISDLELTPVKPQRGLTYFASFVLDNKYYVGNVAVYTLLDGSGFRCVYPTKKLPNGKNIPLFYPISTNITEAIRKIISAEAQRLMTVKNNQLVGKYIFGTKQED